MFSEMQKVLLDRDTPEHTQKSISISVAKFGAEKRLDYFWWGKYFGKSFGIG